MIKYWFHLCEFILQSLPLKPCSTVSHLKQIIGTALDKQREVNQILAASALGFDVQWQYWFNLCVCELLELPCGVLRQLASVVLELSQLRSQPLTLFDRRSFELEEENTRASYLCFNMDQHSLHWGDILNKLLNVGRHHRSSSVELLHASKLCNGKKLHLVTIQNRLHKYCLREQRHLQPSRKRKATKACHSNMFCMQFYLHAWKLASLFIWWWIAHDWLLLSISHVIFTIRNPPTPHFQVYSSSMGPWPPAATSSTAWSHSASLRATSGASTVQSTNL